MASQIASMGSIKRIDKGIQTFATCAIGDKRCIQSYNWRLGLLLRSIRSRILGLEFSTIPC